MDKNYIGWANFLGPAIMKNAERSELAAELTESVCSTEPQLAAKQLGSEVHIPADLVARADREKVQRIGIPAEMIERIFEAFVRVNATHARAAEGTGLGLTISRDLARGMGGDLRAESAVGKGSTFILSLPRAG